MFYERYLELCSKNIAQSAAATKAGFNRGTVSVWKKKYEAGLDVAPEQDIINKICIFFGCSELWLRGMANESKKTPAFTGKEPQLSDQALMFALFGDSTEVSDADLEDVKKYAAFIAERKKMKK